GRGAGTPRLRGVTLIHELLAAGVSVRLGSDNIQDAFYPYGAADPLESAWLAALTAQIDDTDALLAGICDGRTRIEKGDSADLVLIEASSLIDALARRPAGRTVMRAGQLLASPAAGKHDSSRTHQP
ncbi:MAG TPA: amidohydrolase family protein, partial [Gaiellaceae bacterium]|nr:amidohydrolase family protein [Gaiellaceae bacterium]